MRKNEGTSCRSSNHTMLCIRVVLYRELNRRVNHIPSSQPHAVPFEFAATEAPRDAPVKHRASRVVEKIYRHVFVHVHMCCIRCTNRDPSICTALTRAGPTVGRVRTRNRKCSIDHRRRVRARRWRRAGVSSWIYPDFYLRPTRDCVSCVSWVCWVLWGSQGDGKDNSTARMYCIQRGYMAAFVSIQIGNADVVWGWTLCICGRGCESCIGTV